jgi:hypothetical protein
MKDVEWCVWEPQEPEAGFAEWVLVRSLADVPVERTRAQATAEIDWSVWEPQEPEAGFAERVLGHSLADVVAEGACAQAPVEGIAWSAWEAQEPEADFASQVVARALVEPLEKLRAPAMDNVKARRRKRVAKLLFICLAACLLPALAIAGELLKSFLWSGAFSASPDERSEEASLNAEPRGSASSAAPVGAPSSTAPVGSASSAALVGAPLSAAPAGAPSSAAPEGAPSSAAYVGAPSSVSTAAVRRDQGTGSSASSDVAPPSVPRGPFDEKAARAEIDRVLQLAKVRCNVPEVFNNKNGFVKVIFSASGALSGGISVAASELNEGADKGITRHELDKVHTCVNMNLGFLVNIKPFEGPPQTITHTFRF